MHPVFLSMSFTSLLSTASFAYTLDSTLASLTSTFDSLSSTLDSLTSGFDLASIILDSCRVCLGRGDYLMVTAGWGSTTCSTGCSGFLDMNDLEKGFGLTSSLGCGGGSAGVASVRTRDSVVLLATVGLTSFSGGLVSTLDSDSCAWSLLWTRRLVMTGFCYTFGFSCSGSFSTTGGCSVTIRERAYGCRGVDWQTRGTNSSVFSSFGASTSTLTVSSLKPSFLRAESTTVGATLSGVLSTFSSFFSVVAVNLSSLSLLAPCLRSIFLPVSAPLRSVSCCASGGGSLILMVLVLGQISLLRENFAGVPLAVSWGASCGCSCSALEGVEGLLSAPLTNLLVEPMKALLMSPMALSGSNCGCVGLLALEALVDWQAEDLFLSISWNITFLSSEDTLVGSSPSRPNASSIAGGSATGG